MKKSTFFKIFRFMKKTWPAYVITLALVSLGNAAIQLLMADLLKETFDTVTAMQLDKLLNVVKTLGFYFLVLCALSPFAWYILGVSIAKTTADMRTRVFTHIQRLPIRYFKEGHSGDLISRMTNDIVEAQGAYSRTVPGFVMQVVAGIGSTVYMIMLDWRLALFCIVTGLLLVLANIYYAEILRKLGQQVQQRLGILTERLSDLLAGINVVRSFNINKIILGKYYIGNDDVYDVSLKRVKVNAHQAAANAILGSVSILGLVSLGAYFSMRGEVTVGAVIGITQLQNGVRELFRALGTFITNLQGSLAAGDRIFELLESDIEPETYHIEKKAVDEQSAISFKETKFAYEDGEMVLDGLNFSVKKGQVVAIVGPSGSGKSTILKLILGFYQSQGGDIQINGRSISGETLEELRQHMAYVPQDAFLYAGTVAENIKMVRENATEEEVIAAAKMANAHNFITEFENGYDTPVGERGTHLSGGQRQRIAIARAILKDAPILLLDEATSALDSESEHLVQEALEKLMVGRTTLVVAHRLSTVQHADKIVVVKEGKVVEEGTHEELLGRGGVYEKLYTQQFTRTLEEVAS